MIYAVLIYGAEDHYDRLPEEEQKATTAQHGVFQDRMREAGALGPFARLMPAGTSVTLRSSGGSVLVTDGPFAETKEQLLGIYLLDCATMEEAVEAVKILPPHVSTYEIRPVAYSHHDAEAGLDDVALARP